MQEYQNDDRKSINLEIFEMEDSASAYGIYTLKTNPKGKQLDIGNGALLEDYYLNFWKGNFLVTLTGFDAEKETVDGLITIAKSIDNKITSKGLKPDLVNFLFTEGLKEHGIKYLKGNLALFNNYDFGSGDIFGLREGVIGEYGEYKLFIFKYQNKYECEKWFENAKEKIQFSSKFDAYDKPESSNYSVINRNGDRIFMGLYQEYIIIVVGSVTTEGDKIIGLVQSKIDSTRIKISH